PSATSEPIRELVGSSPIVSVRVAYCVVLELRSLRSAGVTRLPRYCGPLRHPIRPSLSLAGCSLAGTRRHRWGFPCCVDLLVNMPSPLPRRDRGVVSLVLPSFPERKRCTPRRRPSPSHNRV